jgi:hypothetical protein
MCETGVPPYPFADPFVRLSRIGSGLSSLLKLPCPSPSGTNSGAKKRASLTTQHSLTARTGFGQ